MAPWAPGSYEHQKFQGFICTGAANKYSQARMDKYKIQQHVNIHYVGKFWRDKTLVNGLI